MFQNAEWIWADEQYPNQRANFLFKTNISVIPPKTIVSIGCETKYRMFVNGEIVIFDGGLFRESMPGCGYYDSADITTYLHSGNNEIIIQVWYYGNGGRNNSYCPKAGLILACKELSLYSSSDTLCYTDNAYYNTKTETPSYLYGGDNTAYDSRIRPFSLCPNGDFDKNTTTVGKYGDAPWGLLTERPIPHFFFTERIACDFARTETKLTVKLPYAMHFSPYIKLTAQGDEVIDIRSDRYEVHGGPGDTSNVYRGHRAEYICHEGEQEFEMADWIFGEEIIFTIPETVTVTEAGYRESGYDSKLTTVFECDDQRINRLFEKCTRTLKICMRENYMDCPDRERGQWIGDVSVQAPQIIYLLDKNGLLLLRKAICDFINLRKGDVLVGNVPGDNYCELPSQSLNAISEIGMIATYYEATKDKTILAQVLEPAVRYLMLWETDSNGVVLPRKGDWEWYDHLYNCDNTVLNICWYYSALRFAMQISTELNDLRFINFLVERMTAIENNFEARYWNDSLRCFTSGSFVDDRANAMAILSGLCSKDKYPQIRYILLSVFNSTTYMEGYVLQALCEMGYKEDALRRMLCRYQPLIDNESNTLWEDFFHLGTKNHAWTGAPATILMRYFVGMHLDGTVTTPDSISPLKFINCQCKYASENNNQ